MLLWRPRGLFGEVSPDTPEIPARYSIQGIIFMQARPERTLLAPGLEISRLVCGLWQVADIEKDGSPSTRNRVPMRCRPMCRLA